MSSVDTIFALSSGKLPAGIAVVRLSGSESRFAIETISGAEPEPRTARYARFRRSNGQVIDSGLALYFPGPSSFTGEDCAEFHLHGSRASVAALLHELGTMAGFRPAEAGEFTRRAFLNGKIDLTGAEALADLIGAETEVQRQLALRNVEGAQLKLYDEWRRRLLQQRALVEAELDFADESDVPGSVSDTVWGEVASLAGEVRSHISGFARAELVREGVRVTIIGAPNAGKSTLLNALARRDVAIVSDEPGTTRDLVEVALDVDGNKILVTDTAGLRETASKAESEGVLRAGASAATAQLVLWLEDVSAPVAVDLPATAAPILHVGSKSDLGVTDTVRRYDLLLSAKSGDGLPDLLDRISSIAAEAAQAVGETLPSRQRHVRHLRDCEMELASALRAELLELRAEHLRRAAEALGRITGRVDVEDLLGAIFSEFCIGK